MSFEEKAKKVFASFNTETYSAEEVQQLRENLSYLINAKNSTYGFRVLVEGEEIISLTSDMSLFNDYIHFIQPETESVCFETYIGEMLLQSDTFLLSGYYRKQAGQDKQTSKESLFEVLSKKLETDIFQSADKVLIQIDKTQLLDALQTQFDQGEANQKLLKALIRYFKK